MWNTSPQPSAASLSGLLRSSNHQPGFGRLARLGSPPALPHSRRRVVTVALLTALLLLSAAAGLRPAHAFAACGNPVACENQSPGDPPSDWQVNGVGDSTIQGYATQMSVNVGQTVSFKINTPSTAYHIDILRLGYYQGDGARKIAAGLTPSVPLPQTQPSCLTDSSTGLIDCGNWGVSATWTVPADAVSGIYVAHLVRDDGADPGGESQIVFVVRNDASHSNMLVSTSDATWEAYNNYGGNSLYTCTVACPPGNPLTYKAAYAVSYNRPFDGGVNIDGGASYLYYVEYQMVRFMEQNGYDVSYTSSSDVDRAGSALLNHKIFVASGHDEYWSAGQRANVVAARDAGVNLAFFTGNAIFWKTRWAASEEGSNSSYRTLITYKETHFNSPIDPKDPPTWTGTWRDPRFSPPADGGNPPNALTGQLFDVNSGTSDITVPSQYSQLRIWRNTAVAQLTPGQSLTLGPGIGTLGYEWDLSPDNGFRPPGLFNLSSTTVNNVETFTDYGSTTATGTTATHHLTLYRAAGGALVFGAGTVQWAWGLDNTNAWNDAHTDPSGLPPDPTMQQATINLFADMGAQPTTLMSGLVSPSASTDNTSPTSAIGAPSSGATVQDGSQVTVSGSASDAGGGVVAGVEVSADGGSTWHPATLTSPDGQTVSWTYSWVAHGNPSVTLESRATDDSGNVGTPADATSVSVSCPCSIWGDAVSPDRPDSGDTQSVEVGMKFKSDVFGTVTGVRFYKSAANGGAHVGSLWTSSGQLLASATFSNETSSGWQQVNFSNPVTIMPNTVYVVSYFAPLGHYAATGGYFYPAPSPPPVGGGSFDSPPLHAIGNNISGDGLYAYSASSTFPTASYNASNYWVDPAFTPAPPPGQVTNVTASAGRNSATVNWSAPSTGGPATTYTVTPYIGSTAQTPTTVNGNPAATTVTVNGLKGGTAYTFTVQASNPNGQGPVSAPSNSVTPLEASAPSAPSGVTGVPASGRALVSWTAPSNDGGSAITGHTVNVYPSGATQPSQQVSAGASATSATVTGLSNGTAYTFTVSATNGVGTGAASAASSAVTPEDTIFDFATPANVDSGDGSAVELGVKFTADSSGTITGIRFYKAAANTGSHVVSLWTTGGQLLASATVTNETPSGWQYATFQNPVSITAGTTYVASYFAPNGHYSYAANAFASSVDNPPLHAVANSTSANGVFAYSASSTFPAGSYNATNYWVDPMFQPSSSTASAPSAPSGVTGVPASGRALVSWTAPSNNGGSAITGYTVTPYVGSTAGTPVQVSDGSATSATVTGLTNGTAYTFTVSATNGVGTGAASSASSAVTPEDTIFDFATPANVDSGDSSAVELGVKFTADSSGTITGIRFYKAAANTGSHVVSLWTTGGQLLASATVTNETPSGWQYATFQNPVSITAGTTYVASYFAPNGHYSYAANAFASSVDNPPLHAVANSTSANGVFAYSASSTFPAGSYNATNYWVDPMFQPAPPDAPTNVSATAGNQSATVSWTAPGNNGGSPITGYRINAYPSGATQPSQQLPAGASATSATVTGLTNGTSYTFTVTATNSVGTSQESVASAPVTPAPTVPGAPTGVSATGGNQTATVFWAAPSNNGGSAITGYTVNVYPSGATQPSQQVPAGASATSVGVSGLTNGTSYTFTVTATNGVGAGPESASSNAVTANPPPAPTFVQQASVHSTNVASAAATLAKPITLNNRIVVLVGVWSSGNATAKTVTDSAGNVYTELQHFTASDGTEQSVWTAPITAGAGTAPKITVTPTGRADVGVGAAEYAGLSTAAGSGAVDVSSHNTGTTGAAAATVSSGPTAATSSANELAIGFYADSGFNDTLAAGSGWTSRINVSKALNMELLLEDQLPASGATPNAGAGTGPKTPWLMSTVVFKHA
jgi:hypothetical protein